MTHASQVAWQIEVDRLEVWDTDQGTGELWEVEAWVGGDLQRLWLRSEGSRSDGRTDNADIELLFGRSVTPWWEVLAGVRQDTRPASRSWAAIGVEGTAPGMIELTAMAYAGSGGQVQLKAEAAYDVRFSNRLILRPSLEATAALDDEPDQGIGSGLNGIEAGWRLRYEISPRFAPYVGVVHERLFGGTAAHARAAGDAARDTRVVAGLRGWW
ncbi:copper resistance protein B [Luteimonas yindakuii]|uniref:copper resistance protein B n=1 Tax=Luteimonas yindakuii TaxID=2565782 RepID=UPI001FC9DA16|nr:copper resistance protein B [Luteimonas yindakuii]